MIRSRGQIINDFKAFVARKRSVGFSKSKITLMAFAYLEALCENGILSYSEESALLQDVGLY